MITTSQDYDTEALLHMKSKPPGVDAEGKPTIGYMVQPNTPEWQAWYSYFGAKGLHGKAAFMMARGNAGKPYMVPDQLPSLFEPGFQFIIKQPPKQGRLASEMTYAERCELVEEFQRAVARIARKGREERSPTYHPQPEPKPDPLARRELTEAEKASAERLAASVQRQRDAAE